MFVILKECPLIGLRNKNRQGKSVWENTFKEGRILFYSIITGLSEPITGKDHVNSNKPILL